MGMVRSGDVKHLRFPQMSLSVSMHMPPNSLGGHIGMKRQGAANIDALSPVPLPCTRAVLRQVELLICGVTGGCGLNPHLVRQLCHCRPHRRHPVMVAAHKDQ